VEEEELVSEQLELEVELDHVQELDHISSR
jgi:hypothetical protein